MRNTESSIVKAFVRRMRAGESFRSAAHVGRRGPSSRGMGDSRLERAIAHAVFAGVDGTAGHWCLGDKALARKLRKKAMKKVGQPHRTNHDRSRMRRRAAGKNEVTR